MHSKEFKVILVKTMQCAKYMENSMDMVIAND